MKNKSVLKLFLYGCLSMLLIGVLVLVVAKVPSVLAQIENSTSSQGVIQTSSDNPTDESSTGQITEGISPSDVSQDYPASGSGGEAYFPAPLTGPDIFTEGFKSQSPGAATAAFYFVAGSTFLTVQNSQSWAYDGMGCIHNTTEGFSLMNLNFQLPNGSRIVLLRVYYDDTLDPTTGYGWITIYPEGGTTFQDLVAVPTLGSSGHGSNYGNLDHIVDNYNQTYVLNWRANVTGSGMQLCGMRVMYYP